MPKIINDVDYSSEVSEGLVLVDFYADWCGPCKMLAPVLESLEAKYEGKVKIVKVNTENDKENAVKLGVRGIPSMFIYKDGEIMENIVGFVPENRIEESIKKYL